jgi:phosphatidate phosphatase LPIN
MSIVNKLLTSVSGLYNHINPLTLSGINDVIVVEDKKGNLRCTEFQLRFGRLYFSGVSNQTVHLFINGKICDITMSISSQGELFFEKNTNADFEMDYDVVLEFDAKFSMAFDSEDEIVLKRKLEELSLGKVPELRDISLEKMMKHEEKGVGEEDMESRRLLRKERTENIKKRMYGMLRHRPAPEDFYSEMAKKYVKLRGLLNSPEHYDFLIKKCRTLLHLINGLQMYLPYNNGKCTGQSKGCAGVNISFSLCSDKKVADSLESLFMSYLVKDVRNPENLVVRIEGCNMSFYLPYSVFCKIFFEIRGSRINKARRLMEALENEYNRLLGWNIFGNRKTIKRDVSFSLKLDSDELKLLNLKPGKNEAVFKVSGLNKQLEGSIYLWKDDAKIVVSDIDGTITKSDVWGHLYGMMGRDWTHHGVASLYTKIVKNGYKIVYLTSRPLGQSSSTKTYLKNVRQDGCKLPDGPVLLSPDGVFAALYRELIIRKPEDFKIACLRTIAELFSGTNPFVAGFGNKITDVITYKALDIPLSRIFTINHKGELYAELVKTLSSTYKTMNDFIDSFFPYLSVEMMPFTDHSYSDFSWWDIR